jgi:hypothetical protein
VSVGLTRPARRDAGLSVRNRRDPLKIRADSSGAARRAGGPALIPPDPGFSAHPSTPFTDAVRVNPTRPARRDAGLPGPNRRDPLKIRADSSGAEHWADGPALIPPDPCFSALPSTPFTDAMRVCPTRPARRDAGLPVRNRRDPSKIRAESSGAVHWARGPALIPPDPGFFSPPFDALCRSRVRRPQRPRTAAVAVSVGLTRPRPAARTARHGPSRAKSARSLADQSCFQWGRAIGRWPSSDPARSRLLHPSLRRPTGTARLGAATPSAVRITSRQ